MPKISQPTSPGVSASDWLAGRTLWQFVLIWGGVLLGAVLIGATLAWLIWRRVNFDTVLTYAVVFAVVSTAFATAVRQERRRYGPGSKKP